MQSSRTQSITVATLSAAILGGLIVSQVAAAAYTCSSSYGSCSVLNGPTRPGSMMNTQITNLSSGQNVDVDILNGSTLYREFSFTSTNVNPNINCGGCDDSEGNPQAHCFDVDDCDETNGIFTCTWLESCQGPNCTWSQTSWKCSDF